MLDTSAPLLKVWVWVGILGKGVVGKFAYVRLLGILNFGAPPQEATLASHKDGIMGHSFVLKPI